MDSSAIAPPLLFYLCSLSSLGSAGSQVCSPIYSTWVIWSNPCYISFACMREAQLLAWCFTSVPRDGHCGTWPQIQLWHLNHVGWRPDPDWSLLASQPYLCCCRGFSRSSHTTLHSSLLNFMMFPSALFPACPALWIAVWPTSVPVAPSGWRYFMNLLRCYFVPVFWY